MLPQKKKTYTMLMWTLSFRPQVFHGIQIVFLFKGLQANFQFHP